MIELIEWWDNLGQRRRLTAAIGAVALLVLCLAVILRLRPDPWAQAIEQTQATLTQSPAFVAHVQSYHTLPSEVDGYVALIERARPLAISDDLRKKQIPLLGNAWQVLTNTLNIVPGAGQKLDTLDDSLRQILTFKGKLAALGDTAALAAATQEFEAKPSRRTLTALRDRCVSYSRVLTSADAEIQAQLATVNTAMQTAGSIEQAFLRVEDSLARLQPVANAVAALRQAISDLFDPLRRLSMALESLHTAMQADLATMASIQRLVAAAE